MSVAKACHMIEKEDTLVRVSVDEPESPASRRVASGMNSGSSSTSVSSSDPNSVSSSRDTLSKNSSFALQSASGPTLILVDPSNPNQPGFQNPGFQALSTSVSDIPMQNQISLKFALEDDSLVNLDPNQTVCIKSPFGTF